MGTVRSRAAIRTWRKRTSVGLRLSTRSSTRARRWEVDLQRSAIRVNPPRVESVRRRTRWMRALSSSGSNGLVT